MRGGCSVYFEHSPLFFFYKFFLCRELWQIAPENYQKDTYSFCQVYEFNPFFARNSHCLLVILKIRREGNNITTYFLLLLHLLRKKV